MGGLSSTYFHRELITYPQVDFVLRGDSTEPPLHRLLIALRDGAAVDKIPNLTWKDSRGIHVNPLTFVPASLDYVDLRPDLMVEMVMRYRDLKAPCPSTAGGTTPLRRYSRSRVAPSNVSPRQLSHQLHAPDEAAETCVSQSREPGRQYGGHMPTDAWADHTGGRSAHGGPRTRDRGSGALAQGQPAEQYCL